MRSLREAPRLAVVLPICSLFALALAQGGSAAGPLDGRAFIGETGEKGKVKGDPESFVFADGQFDPTACHQYGFSATPYQATVDGAKTSFVAEHANKAGDRMRWEGTVEGGNLEGKMTYWEGKNAAQEYWFKGTAP